MLSFSCKSFIRLCDNILWWEWKWKFWGKRRSSNYDYFSSGLYTTIADAPANSKFVKVQQLEFMPH